MIYSSKPAQRETRVGHNAFVQLQSLDYVVDFLQKLEAQRLLKKAKRLLAILRTVTILLSAS